MSVERTLPSTALQPTAALISYTVNAPAARLKTIGASFTWAEFHRHHAQHENFANEVCFYPQYLQKVY